MAVACDSTSLVANATCYQCQIPDGYKLPVLIALAVKIAGVNPDANYLVSQAACLECQIPPGMELPVLIGVACAIADGQPTPAPCVNLIPSGATYDSGIPIYLLTTLLTIGTNYNITWGTNEVSLYVNNVTIPSTGVGTVTNFTYNIMGVPFLSGNSRSAPVTAIIC